MLLIAKGLVKTGEARQTSCLLSTSCPVNMGAGGWVDGCGVGRHAAVIKKVWQVAQLLKQRTVMSGWGLGLGL